MRDSCLSPEASLRLVKFVPDEFVAHLLPSCNSNYLGYREVNLKRDERKSGVAKTFSWLAGRLLQICGQVNNYPRSALRFQRQLAAQGADPLAHALNTESGNFVRADTDTVILHFQAQPLTLLKQGNGDLAGIGVFTDVIEQLLQQPIEGKNAPFRSPGWR